MNILSAIENALATTSEPTPFNLGNRRAESSRNLIAKIDAAIGEVSLPDEAAKTAPITFECCRELDGRGAGHRDSFGKKVRHFPPHVFSFFDPDAATYAGQVLQKDFGRMIPFRTETFEALLGSGARLGSGAILSDAEIARAREIQMKMDELLKQMAKFSNAAANAEFYAQSSRLVVETLQSGSLPEKNIRTMDSIHKEFETKRRALTELLMELSHEIFPLAVQAHVGALKILRSLMIYTEISERETAKDFHIPWCPSYLWKSCFAAQIRIHPDRLRAAVESVAQPRDLLAGILTL